MLELKVIRTDSQEGKVPEIWKEESELEGHTGTCSGWSAGAAGTFSHRTECAPAPGTAVGEAEGGDPARARTIWLFLFFCLPNLLQMSPVAQPNLSLSNELNYGKLILI